MPKKTTDKKLAEKKDTGKKQNVGKASDDSKVRFFVSVSIELGSIGGNRAAGENSRPQSQ